MPLSYPRQVVNKLLSDQKCDRFRDLDEGGWEMWIKDDIIIIQLPAGDNIDWDIFEMIAQEQLGMSDWELDYWLGENT